MIRLGIDIVPVGFEEQACLIEVIGQGTAAFDNLLAGSGERPLLLVPEITADLVARGADPLRLAKIYGMRTLIFVHDLIPLKLRTHYAADVVAMFEVYFASVARSDGLLVTTQTVADELRIFFETKALRAPQIEVVPLPAQFGDYPRVREPKAPRAEHEALKLITVSSWEPRKNLPRLLRALGRAQRESRAVITLTLVGRRGLFPDLDAEVEAELADVSNVEMRGPLSDDKLAALITACDLTVYASWEEGFGLPIGESLWLGTPCLCHNGSVMADVASGGGTLAVDMTDAAAIADAMLLFAKEPVLQTRLADEARNRPLTSWEDYAGLIARTVNAYSAPLRG